MIKRGRGAFVDLEDRKKHGLHQGEYDLLHTMMKVPTAGHNSSVWANMMTMPEHRISGWLSYLKGMDLIKSSSDSTLLTDEELAITKDQGVAIYWIGGIGTPIYKRAKYALDTKRMPDILQGRMDFDLNLLPLRTDVIFTMGGNIHRLDGDEVTLTFPRVTGHNMVQLLQLLEQKEVMVTIETL